MDLRAQFHDNLIRLNLVQNISCKIINVSDKFFGNVLKAEYIVYLCMYIHITCIC